jgi:hypothetical protein
VLGFGLLSGPIPGWRPVGAGDFNGDGKLDLVWQNDTTREVHVWYLTVPQGDALLGFGSLSGPVPGWTAVTTTDVNADGKPDLVWQNGASREVHVWYLSDTTLLGFGLLAGPVPGWHAVGLSDLNHDGKADLIWRNDTTRAVHVWYLTGPQGDAILGFGVLSGPVPGWTAIGLNDLNADGNPDLIWQNDATREVHVWYLTGPQGATLLGFGSLSGPVPGWRARI